MNECNECKTPKIVKIRYISYTLNLFKTIAVASPTGAVTVNSLSSANTYGLLHSPWYFQPGSAVIVLYTIKNVMSC